MRRCCAAGLREQLLLEFEALGRALLHEVDTRDGGFGRINKGERARCRQRCQQHFCVCAARVGQHRANLALGLRINIVDAHIDAIQQKARGPAGTDDPAAKQADRGEWRALCHACFVSRNFSRTAAGPSTLTFMFSRIVTARATSSALVARRPRLR